MRPSVQTHSANTPRARRRSVAPGFTLLEVLLALVVGAIILIAINGLFFGALRLRERTTRMVEEGLPVQRALAILTRDLANLLPPGGGLAGAFTTTPTNVTRPGQVTPDLFTASARVDDSSPWSEAQKVAYLLLESTNTVPGSHQLVRSVSRNLLPPTFDTPVYEPLLDGVLSLVLRYYDGSQWLTTWDSTTATTPLPVAIKAELQLASAETIGSRLAPPITVVVPILVDGSTNAPAQASTGTTP